MGSSLYLCEESRHQSADSTLILRGDAQVLEEGTGTLSSRSGIRTQPKETWSFSPQHPTLQQQLHIPAAIKTGQNMVGIIS
jgi:hypothetical protein